VTQAAADTVLQAFEATFQQQGWTVLQSEHERLRWLKLSRHFFDQLSAYLSLRVDTETIDSRQRFVTAARPGRGHKSLPAGGGAK